MRRIEVVDYREEWAGVFDVLKERVWEAVGDFALGVEHVGSTAVPGLAAKPIIDLSVVVESEDDVALAIARLATLGYEHRGDLGVAGREAFRAPEDLPRHHLYVCAKNNLALKNHLALRDYLRAHPGAVRAYGELKKRLAVEFHDDIESYIAGKTAFIVSILDKMRLSSDELASIEAVNRSGKDREAQEAQKDA